MADEEKKPEDAKREPVVVTVIAGNVGGTPERKTTSKGDVVNFSVATNPTTEKDAPAKWFRVGVWGENLIDAAQKLKKGNRVVVVGKAYETEFNNETQFNINAYRIGLVEYLRKAEGAGEATHEEEVGW